MEFRILGGLEMLHEGRDITPSAPKLRRVLCCLILHPNQLVQTESLIDELWGDNPVSSALTTVQTYIYLLRKVINAELGDGAGEDFLITRPSGYMAMTPKESIDLFRFEALVEEGRAELNEGAPDRASQILTRAMDMWRGSALADVRAGRALQAHITRLEERRLGAMELRIESDLRCGRHRELISELKALTVSHSYHEGFYRPLMLALYRSGRQWEALDVYQRLRQLLIDDLGLEPSAELTQLHQAVLTTDPSLDLPAGPATTVAHVADAPKAPTQLPPDIADFTGRGSQADRVIRLLAEPSAGTPAPTVMVTGMAGVGKTSLAVHVAHQVKARYPDGQLYADLRGSEDDGPGPDEVVSGFLRALGVPRDRIPLGLAQRGELFRAWTADRRLLVVLDDVADAERIRELLPGGPHCGTLVTARSLPEGTPAGETVRLGELTPEEGRQLLGRLIGWSRLRGEQEAADQIVSLCARLPLAVRAAGARLAMMPFMSLGGFRDQLAEERDRLDQLRSADFDVRAVFEEAYWRLTDTERAVLRWLSLLPNTAFTARSAATLLGMNTGPTRELLERLSAAHFLRRVGYDGAGTPYYRFVDLPRAMVHNHVTETLSQGLRVC